MNSLSSNMVSDPQFQYKNTVLKLNQLTIYWLKTHIKFSFTFCVDNVQYVSDSIIQQLIYYTNV